MRCQSPSSKKFLASFLYPRTHRSQPNQALRLSRQSAVKLVIVHTMHHAFHEPRLLGSPKISMNSRYSGEYSGSG